MRLKQGYSQSQGLFNVFKKMFWIQTFTLLGLKGAVCDIQLNTSGKMAWHHLCVFFSCSLLIDWATHSC